jgi:menaquinol-cytochrome c reductase iron-sulfur subunit
MQRRSFLKWTINSLGAVIGAVLGIPAVAFLVDARNRPAPQTGFRPITKLSELEINQFKEFVIRETRRDAWNLHPDDIVGRIWMVRKPGDKVLAWTTTCPHLGCSINRTETGFLCPCHGASFDDNGKRLTPDANPAPRDMDTLPVDKIDLPIEPGQPPDFEIQVEFAHFKASQPEKVEDK